MIVKKRHWDPAGIWTLKKNCFWSPIISTLHHFLSISLDEQPSITGCKRSYIFKLYLHKTCMMYRIVYTKPSYSSLSQCGLCSECKDDILDPRIDSVSPYLPPFSVSQHFLSGWDKTSLVLAIPRNLTRFTRHFSSWEGGICGRD